MGRLDDYSLDDLHEQLERTEGNTPTQRVLAAIGRKQGATLDELAERHGVTEKTVRNWLDRFAEQPLADAPYDEKRSGRPKELTDEARKAFLEDLRESPVAVGYGREEWDPGLARHHLSEAYGIEYSHRHVYRLLDEAGVGYRPDR